MINLILFLIILGCLLYAIYDQILLQHLNGKTQFSVTLIQPALDGWILFGLILLTVMQGISDGIEPLTLFLLAGCILLALYALFFRQSRWLFKDKGCYLNGIFIAYPKIKAINQAEFKNKPVFVIDLNNGKRLFAQLKNQNESESIIRFLAKVER